MIWCWGKIPTFVFLFENDWPVLHLCPYNHSCKVRVEEIPVEYSWVQKQPDSRWGANIFVFTICGEHPSYLSFLVLTITILIVVMACDINIGGVIPNISESASKYKHSIMFPPSGGGTRHSPSMLESVAEIPLWVGCWRSKIVIAIVITKEMTSTI